MESADVDISVLQESTLGPILFLCFINDIHHATTLFSLLFADDTCLLAADKNLKSVIELCNVELKKIANWLMANKLAVNVSKCKFIIFHNRGKIVNHDEARLFFNSSALGGEELPEKIIPMERISNHNENLVERSYKYLGIYLDENFSLNYHFDNLCKKLSVGLFCLRRAKNTVNKKSLKTLYYSLFYSHLFYCSNILNCSSNANIKKVTILQKKAIHMIENANYNDYTFPIFKKLKILPFDKILLHHKLIFMHGIIHKHNNRSFKNTWQYNVEREIGITLRNFNNLILPAPRFEGFKKFPLFDFAKTWNELGEMKLQNNLSIFKSWLKDETFSN